MTVQLGRSRAHFHLVTFAYMQSITNRCIPTESILDCTRSRIYISRDRLLDTRVWTMENIQQFFGVTHGQFINELARLARRLPYVNTTGGRYDFADILTDLDYAEDEVDFIALGRRY